MILKEWTVPQIARQLGVVKRTVYNHIDKLLKAHAIKSSGGNPRAFTKGRFSGRWDKGVKNCTPIDMGVVETFPHDVPLEEIGSKLRLFGLPDTLPDWDSPKKGKDNPWLLGHNVWLHKLTIPLSMGEAVLTFTAIGKNGAFKQKVKLQVKGVSIPPQDVKREPEIRADIEAEVIQTVRDKYGFGFWRWVEHTSQTQFCFRVNGTDKVHKGQVQLTENCHLDHSRKDGHAEGPSMVETPDRRVAKNIAEPAEALVQVEDWVKENRNGILGILKRIDGIDDKVKDIPELISTMKDYMKSNTVTQDTNEALSTIILKIATEQNERHNELLKRLDQLLKKLTPTESEYIPPTDKNEDKQPPGYL